MSIKKTFNGYIPVRPLTKKSSASNSPIIIPVDKDAAVKYILTDSVDYPETGFLESGSVILITPDAKPIKSIINGNEQLFVHKLSVIAHIVGENN